MGQVASMKFVVEAADLALLRRRARMKALLVALLLLVVGTGTAFAECAWVLWVKGEGLAGTYKDWSPLRAFDTHGECESWDLGKASGLRGYDTRCLPDTVDPRGPKGK